MILPEDQILIDEIINKIRKWMGPFIINPARFYIGITDYPERRKQEHDNPRFFYSVNCFEAKIAREVEKYFLQLGMKGGEGGGDEKSTYIYVFILE